MTLTFNGCGPLLAEDPSGFNAIRTVHFCSDVGRETFPQSTSSTQRILQYRSEGIQREENCDAESLRDKDFNEKQKKSTFCLQNVKEIKQKKEIARNFLPRPARKLS